MIAFASNYEQIKSHDFTHTQNYSIDNGYSNVKAKCGLIALIRRTQLYLLKSFFNKYIFILAIESTHTRVSESYY